MMVAKEVHDKAQDPMAWFQHDSNAAQDQKCQRLLFRYGNAGYGAFWRLCEILANTTMHSLPVETDEDWLILAEQIGMRKAGAFDEISSVDDCKDFIGCLLEIGLLTLRRKRAHRKREDAEKRSVFRHAKGERSQRRETSQEQVRADEIAGQRR